MSPRTFVIWWIAAAAAIAAAVVAVTGQPGLTTAAVSSEPAFPDLRASPDAVATVEIATAEGSFTLERRDDGWVAIDLYDYPVETQQVLDLISALADMRLLEAKTSRPDRFARLEVEDVDRVDARSRHIRLTDGDGEVLAEVYVGKRVSQASRYATGGTYVRRGGDDRAWLASGSLDVSESAVDWLSSEIVDIPRTEVRHVGAVPAEGDAYAASRTDADAEMTLEDVPEGQTPDQTAVNRTASVLVGIRLADVRPVAEIEMPDRRSFVSVTTFDGVQVLAETAMVEGEPWAVFTARYVGPITEDAEPSEAAPENGAEVDGDPAGDEEAAVVTEGTEDDPATRADAARMRAEDIAHSLDGWAFRLEESIAERLNRSLDDLMADDGTS